MQGEFNKPQNTKEFKTIGQRTHSIILYNDDVNLFEFVVDSLIEVCKLDSIQAEQCTLIAHYKGKCDVKYGTYELLIPIKDELLNRGLSATIIQN